MKKLTLTISILIAAISLQAQSWNIIKGRTRIADYLGIPYLNPLSIAAYPPASDTCYLYISKQDSGLYYKVKGTPIRVANLSSIPGTPSLQDVTDVDYTTTNPIEAASMNITDGSNGLSMVSGGSLRLSAPTVTGYKVQDFQDASGTLALTSDIKNIYNSDGTLSTDRNVNGNQKRLTITNLDYFDIFASKTTGKVSLLATNNSQPSIGGSYPGGLIQADNSLNSTIIAQGYNQNSPWGYHSKLELYKDSFSIKPWQGNLYIDSLNRSSAGSCTMLVWDSVEKRVQYQTLPLSVAAASGTYLPLAGGTMTGNLLFSADNTKDIGASGATRPRTGYFGTSIVTPSANITSSTGILSNASNGLRWGAGYFIASSGNGGGDVLQANTTSTEVFGTSLKIATGTSQTVIGTAVNSTTITNNAGLTATMSGNDWTIGQWGSSARILAAGGGTGNTNRLGIDLSLNSGQSTGNRGGGAITFNTSSSGSSGSALNSYVERMRIDSAGNVGIGTTSPTTRLQVNSGSALKVFSLGSAATGSYVEKMYIDSAGKITVPSTGLITNGTSYFSFNGNNAIIGTNSANRTIVNVLGDTYPNVNNTQELGVSGQAWKSLYVNGLTAVLGNVGIGTTSPGGRLEVKASSSTSGATDFAFNNSSGANLFKVRNDGYVTLGSGSTASSLDIIGTGSGGVYSPGYSPQSNNILRFKEYTSGNTQVYMDFTSDGSPKVGIGTTSPTATLHVTQTAPASVATTTVAAQTAPLKVIGSAGGETSSNGSTVTAGAAGAITITGGNGGAITGSPTTGIGGAGSNITVLAGDGGLGTTFGGAAGSVEIQGGTGGGGTSGGTAGYAALKGGNAGSTGGANGGNVYVIPGIGQGAGQSGSVFLGLSPSNTVRGNVVIGSSSDDYANKLQVAGSAKFDGLVILKSYTVATLPTGVTGAMCYVTDATAPTYGATLVGGGAVTTMAFYNGTNWTAH